MPMHLLSVYQEEMGQIDASEHLAMITAFAVGSGSLTKHDSQRIISQLQRAASGKRKKTISASPGLLASMGIAVEKVKKDG